MDRPLDNAVAIRDLQRKVRTLEQRLEALVAIIEHGVVTKEQPDIEARMVEAGILKACIRCDTRAAYVDGLCVDCGMETP